MTFFPSVAGDVTGYVASHLISDVLGFFNRYLEDAAVFFLKLSVDIISSSPEPNLASDWYRGQYHLMLQIAGYLAIAVVLCATISAVLKGGLKEVLRTYFVGLPVAVFGGVAAIALVTLLQKVDQDMTRAVLTHTTQYFSAFYTNMNKYGNQAGNFGTVLIEIWLFWNMIFFVLVLWIELVARQVMIYMAVLFLPLGLAAYAWPPLRSWLAGLAEIVVTMVFSKFIIAAVMSFGFLSINQGLTAGFSGQAGEAVAAFLGGILTIIVACFAAPVLIMFVMQPNHEIVSRQSIQGRLPIGADQTAARGLVTSSLGKVGQKLGLGGGGGAAKGLAKGKVG